MDDTIDLLQAIFRVTAMICGIAIALAVLFITIAGCLWGCIWVFTALFG